MTLHVNVIRARTPWEGTCGAPEISQKEAAPTQEVVFCCSRCGPFTVTFYAEAEPPDVWGCRCGLDGRRVGTEGIPDSELRLPGYTTVGTGKYERVREDVTPLGQLRKRKRTQKQREALEAEALKRAQQARVVS